MAGYLLVLAVVPGHSSVGGLSLDCLAVRAHKDWGHQSQRAITYNKNKAKLHKPLFNATHIFLRENCQVLI